ncbi:MAG: CHASE2 domain-containing protein, partial [Bdellovibrionales bacterium]
MERDPKISAGRRPKLFAALRVLLAAGIGLFICQLNLDYIESLFYDIRVRTRPAPQTSGKIALINIDTKTQERLKRQPEALDIAFFLRQLAESKPAQIIYSQDFSEIIGSFDELEDLAAVATKIPFVVVEDHKLPEVGLEEEFRLLPPLQNISVISGPKTDDSNTFARDGVTRRMILTFENSPLLHMKIASSINNKMTANDYRGSFDFKRTSQAYINFHPSGFYDTYSYIDIIDGKIASENFKDKIIIIGRDTHSDRKDYIQTPYSRDILAMSRTELHANMIDTLLMNDAPLKLPEWFNVILTMFIAILTVLVVLRERPARGFLILAFMLVGFSATAILLFSIAGIWIDVAHPFLSLFICYYFFIPYR